MRLAPKNAGFTLIELLIVVVILSTLAAIVVPQFSSSSDSSKTAAAKSTLSGMRSAIGMYQQEKGEYPLVSTPTFCAGSGVTLEPSNAGQLHQTLSLYSKASGELCNTRAGGYVQGPYLSARTFPPNPLSGNSNTLSLSNGTTLGVGASSSGAEAWRYQPSTGEFIINDATDGRDQL